MNGLTLWTALPNGIRRTSADAEWTAHISVFVTPRLTPTNNASTLQDFPAFIDWPATLRSVTQAGLHFDVHINDGRSLSPPVVVNAVRPNLPTSDAWRAIFPASTPVRTQSDGALTAGNARSTDVTFYDGKTLAEEVRHAYRQTLLQQTDRNGALRALKQTQTAADRTGDPLAAFRASKADRLGAAPTSNADSVTQFLQFHRGTQTPRQPSPRTSASNDTLDVHQIITVISTHGELLRQLGLVIDLEVPLTALNAVADPSAVTLQVMPRGLPETVDWRSLRTAAEFATAGNETYRVFCAAAQSHEATYGFYALNTPSFGVSQEQFETATLSLLQHTDGSGSNTAMPRLLQGGMRLLDTSIPAQIRSALADTQELESALKAPVVFGTAANTDNDTAMPVLFAEQLIRGYRIDVQDSATDIWRSLCARSNHYAAGDWQWPGKSATVDDEGAVEFMVFNDDHDETGAPRTLQDLFNWDGWSLAVPRPGNTESAETKPPVKIDSIVRAGSLQAQRFGASYRFRARSVDIAGNSLTPDDADALSTEIPLQHITSQANRFTRVESVLPPIVFPAQEPDLDESGDVLIIRDAESATFRKTRSSAHVFPPATNIDMAERHGVFDALDAASAWQLIERHQGRLDSDADGTERRFLPAQPTAVPYLPDPLATHVVIGLPGIDGSVVIPTLSNNLPTRADAPLAQSCLLTIRPGKNEIRHAVRNRQCIVDVPKGRSLTVQLTCRPSRDALHALAMADPQWLGVDADEDTTRKALGKALDDGNAELVAPRRTLQVVHACQRPLITPVFDNPYVADRAHNDTHAVFYDPKLLLDIGSTGRIDLYGRWQDIEDRPGTAGWTRLDQNGHIGGVDLAEDAVAPFDRPPIDGDARPPLRFEFGDTRHHIVALQAVAITRFVDLYPAALTDDIDNMSRHSKTVTLHVPSSAAPPPPAIAYVMPTFRHTTETVDALTAQASQQGDGLRLYLRRGWFASGVGEQLSLVFAAQPFAAGERDDVSVWGVNTLHETADLPGQLMAGQVTSGAAHVQHIDEQGRTTVRIPHDVQFSAEHNCAFVDCEFAPQLAFMPLVRLVVARYQPHAIDGCHHSPSVTTDFVPLAPGRHVTVQKTTTGRWTVDMRGGGYIASGQQQNQHVVEAVIEALPKHTPQDSAAWFAIGSASTLTAVLLGDFSYRWHGDVMQSEFADVGRRRLVIREYEAFAHNDLPADAPLADYARVVSVHTIAL